MVKTLKFLCIYFANHGVQFPSSISQKCSYGSICFLWNTTTTCQAAPTIWNKLESHAAEDPEACAHKTQRSVTGPFCASLSSSGRRLSATSDGLLLTKTRPPQTSCIAQTSGKISKTTWKTFFFTKFGEAKHPYKKVHAGSSVWSKNKNCPKQLNFTFFSIWCACLFFVAVSSFADCGGAGGAAAPLAGHFEVFGPLSPHC